MSDTKQNWRSIEEVRLIVLGGTGNLSNFVRVCVSDHLKSSEMSVRSMVFVEVSASTSF